MNGEYKRTRAMLILLSAAAIAALSACNTVSGVGKDLQEASHNVKQAIED